MLELLKHSTTPTRRNTAISMTHKVNVFHFWLDLSSSFFFPNMQFRNFGSCVTDTDTRCQIKAISTNQTNKQTNKKVNLVYSKISNFITISGPRLQRVKVTLLIVLDF